MKKIHLFLLLALAFVALVAFSPMSAHGIDCSERAFIPEQVPEKCKPPKSEQADPPIEQPVEQGEIGRGSLLGTIAVHPQSGQNPSAGPASGIEGSKDRTMHEGSIDAAAAEGP